MSRRIVLLAVFMLSFAPLFAQQPATQPTNNTITLAQRLGYPPTARLLIIHADDFGMMHTVDTATEEAFDNHWITSASILVPCPWFPEVAQWAKAHPDADLGIHLALNADWTSLRWSSVSPQPKNSSLLDPDGYLPLTPPYVVAHAKPADVETEVHAQVDKALAAGIHITHLDTHMGTIVSSSDLINVYLAASKSYKLPVLLARDSGLHSLPAFPPDAIVLDGVLQIHPGIPQSQWLDTYEKILQPLPPGTYQLIVHLAHNDAEIQGATFDHPDWGAEWRQNDLDLVKNPKFQKFLKDQHFILVSWKDLSKASPDHKP
jgi:predicted glycoside hydrolase/deacetylase ChbG (UPF0249 family)